MELSKEAISVWSDLVDRFPDRPSLMHGLTSAYDLNASLLHDQREFEQSIAQYEKAIALDQRLAETDEYKDSLEFRLTALGKRQNLSNSLFRFGRRAECAQMREKTVEEWRELLQQFPQRPQLQADLAMAIYAWAECYSWKEFSDSDRAIELGQEAVKILRPLATTNLETPRYRARLTTCLNGLAGHYAAADKYGDAEEYVREAIAVAEELAESYPNVPDYHGKVARRYRQLGRIALRTKQYLAAISAFQRTIEIREQLQRHFPEYSKPMYVVPIASAELLLAIAHQRLGKDSADGDHLTNYQMHLESAIDRALAANAIGPLGQEVRSDLSPEEMQEIADAIEYVAKAATERRKTPDTH